MYQVEIKTKYNIIHLTIEDIENEQFKEILEQPYIEEVRVEKVAFEKKLKL